MDVGKVGSTAPVTSQTASQVASQATEAVKAANKTPQPKTDRAEIGNRNPANKKEIMSTYSNLRPQMANLQNQAIISAHNGGSSALNITPLAVQASAITAPENKAAASSKTTTTTANTGIPAGNKVTDAGRTKVTITNATGNTGNTVQGPKGFGNNNNQVAVNGANNSVNLSGTPAAGVNPETQALTGGPGINNANVSVTGNSNAVKFTGGLQKDNTLNVNGNNNSVNVGNAVSGANINVKGGNVSVNMADNNLLTRNQNSWNISVEASNVNVTVENGKAVVTGANGASTQGLKIDINNEKHTITVTAANPATAGSAPVPGEDLGT